MAPGPEYSLTGEAPNWKSIDHSLAARHGAVPGILVCIALWISVPLAPFAAPRTLEEQAPGHAGT